MQIFAGSVGEMLSKRPEMGEKRRKGELSHRELH